MRTIYPSTAFNSRDERARKTSLLLSLLILALFVLFAWKVIFASHSSLPSHTREEPLPEQEHPVDARLLFDEDYFKAIQPVIATARQSIFVIMYVFHIGESDENPARTLADILAQRSESGVEVTVLLSGGGHDIDLIQGNQHTAQFLRRHGVAVLHSAEAANGGQLHAKLVVIDDELAFLGNHNWTMSALRDNAEVSIELHGEAVRRLIAPATRRLLERESAQSDEDAAVQEPPPSLPPTPQIYRWRDAAGRLHVTQSQPPDLAGVQHVRQLEPRLPLDRARTGMTRLSRFRFFLGQPIADTLEEISRKASVHIDVGTYYASNVHLPYVSQLFDTWSERAKHGVEVNIAIEMGNKEQQWCPDLLPNIEELGLYGRCYLDPRIQHLKALAIDERVAFVGSQNLSISALRGDNWEAGVIFESDVLAKELTQYLRSQK